jgi:hypothetical protein
MSQSEWRAVLAARDQLMAMCFLGVAAFSLNWFVWPHAREMMTWIAIILMIVALTVRIAWM